MARQYKAHKELMKLLIWEFQDEESEIKVLQ